VIPARLSILSAALCLFSGLGLFVLLPRAKRLPHFPPASAEFPRRCFMRPSPFNPRLQGAMHRKGAKHTEKREGKKTERP